MENGKVNATTLINLESMYCKFSQEYYYIISMHNILNL